MVGMKLFPSIEPQRAFQTIVSAVIDHGAPEARATVRDAVDDVAFFES
jgi:hypothetical protein